MYEFIADSAPEVFADSAVVVVVGMIEVVVVAVIVEILGGPLLDPFKVAKNSSALKRAASN